MELWQKIPYEIFNATSTYLMIAGIIVFLHCFYDGGFQWNKKKALILLAYTLLFTIADALTVDGTLHGYSDVFSMAENGLTEENLDAIDVAMNDWLTGNIHTALIFLFFEIAAVILAVYDFKGKKIRGIAIFVLAYYLIRDHVLGLTMLLANYVLNQNGDILFFISAKFVGGGSLVYTILSSIFFGIVFSYLYLRVYRKNIVMRCGKRENISIIVYYFVCYVINQVLINHDIIKYALEMPVRENDLPVAVFAGAYTLLMLIIPLFIYYTRIQGYYKERTQYQEKFMEAELEHFMQFKKAQEETQRFRHDIRNDLLCMNEMLQNGKAEEAGKYLQDLLGVSERLSAKYVTGDEMLDCIVSAKAGSMEQRGIKFRLDGVLAGGLGWKPMDICSVFANALDNAAEACMQLPEEMREIEMKIKSTPQFWFVRIENPVKEPVNVGLLFQEKGGYTTKQNAGKHGIGTYNMKHTVESNGGMLQAECTNLRFILEIMIDKTAS